MITASLWAKNISMALERVADEAFQKRAWLGIGPEVSSPSEIYNTLFDDCVLDEFISESPAFVSADTIRALMELERQMDAIEVDDAHPEGLLESPAWKNVREAARIAATLLKRDTPPN